MLVTAYYRLTVNSVGRFFLFCFAILAIAIAARSAEALKASSVRNSLRSYYTHMPSALVKSSLWHFRPIGKNVFRACLDLTATLGGVLPFIHERNNYPTQII